MKSSTIRGKTNAAVGINKSENKCHVNVVSLLKAPQELQNQTLLFGSELSLQSSYDTQRNNRVKL